MQLIAQLLIAQACGANMRARKRAPLGALPTKRACCDGRSFASPASKWNGIEHRLFAYITQNWRGKPLVSHKVIIQLIAATSTGKGLTVTCDIDRSRYRRGIRISKAELAAINIERHSFHGEWNYTIKPETSLKRLLCVRPQVSYSEFRSVLDGGF